MAFTDVGKAIYSILTNDAGVSALVGTDVFASRAKQEATVPFIVYGEVSNTPTDTKDRPSPMDRIRVQIDCYGLNRKLATDVHLAVRTALDAYTIGSTVAGVTLDGVKFETQNETVEESQDVHRKSSDYIFRVKY